MAPQAKVGSWLANSEGKTNGTEAYDSDSGSSSDHRGSVSDSDEEMEEVEEQPKAATVARARDVPSKPLDDDDDEDEEPALREEVDWEKVVPKIRLALLDPSDSRRRDFIQRYLSISESNPPFEQVPAIIKSILQALPSLSDIHGIDDTIQVLAGLVKRDEAMEEGARLKLGVKLVKWVTMEVDNATATSKARSLSSYMPYTLLILGLLEAYRTAATSSEALSTSKEIQDLLVLLGYLIDAIDTKGAGAKGKETARVERARHRLHIRLWREMRNLRDVLPSILHHLATVKVTHPVKLASLISHVAQTTYRLRGRRREGETTGQRMVEAESDNIMSFYATNIVSSKTTVPPHILEAFRPILPMVISLDILKDKLLPAAEKMLLRSPEVALDIVSAMIIGCPIDISALLPGKLLPAVLSSAKSSNADTRAKAIGLLRTLSVRSSDQAVKKNMITEILALTKTNKTSSAEHRAALFAMAAEMDPSDEVSTIVVDTLAPLIGKETNELALLSLCRALSTHLAYLLQSDVAISTATAAAISKELVSTKIATRRLLSDALGEAIWPLSDLPPNAESFLAAQSSSFEANLQTASGNLPSNAAGFLEGYVVAALTFGPLQSSKTIAKLRSSANIASLATLSPKPSFLLNDRAYAKLPNEVDEKWFLRALKGLITSWGTKSPGASVRTAVGMALLHIILEGKDPHTRHEAITLPSQLASTQPRLISQLLHDTITAWLSIQDAKYSSDKPVIIDDDDRTSFHAQKIGHLLSSIFTSGDKANSELLADRAIDFLVLAHHHIISENAQVSWISLVQGLGLDPTTLVTDHFEEIMKIIWDAAGAPPKDAKFAQAAHRAIATLCFVCPTLYVPAMYAQVRRDLDATALDFIGLEERGIWATPPDQLFVDVLSTKKDAPENKNRRDYATEKWEAEVRASIAAKQATKLGANLSKADKALVAAQMTKEADVRARIVSLQAHLRRGIDLVASLIASNAEAVEKHVRDLAEILLACVFGAGSFLADRRAFDVFISLATLANPRLGEYRRMLAASILRSYDAPLIPDDYLEEPVGELVTRLLHQINFLASQNPLDSTTYALASMLLSRIVVIGGAGTDGQQSEEAQEQLTLVVSIIAACVGEFQNDAYPRLQTIQDLFQIIVSHPKLAKDATSALIDLGAAIKDLPRPEEVRAMIQGTLSRDLNARSAALQALQPVDLTDLDYSEELWIATHDADEQNASLATHLWDDNGLDIPETYLASLLTYLAHESAAVRRSTAVALADAAEHYPSQTQPTVVGLQTLYEDKARLLMPEYDRFGMVIPETVNRADPFEARIAIAAALEKMAPLLNDGLIVPIFEFLVVKEALGDRQSEVRRTMLNAGIAIIDTHGDKVVADLMKMFEDYLAKGGESSETADYIKEAVVILFGRLAGHLEPSDSRIPKVVDRLVEALNTPSELVQAAVADCLPPLVQGMGDEVEYLVDKLFSTLTTGAKYAGRRGAAYGLAGVVKGRGLVLLKEYELLDKLKEAAEDKGAYQSRQGAVFAFETLSATLGKVFEPYIIATIPTLLALFGDGNADVREATQDAAKVIMSKISGHCVKLMLPNLLDALEEKQWRTKKGSIELLGAMAFCAPRQLSLSLPTIIPQLTGVINDSHAQVKAAANTSLKRFGEVLENPEIKAIQNTLMKALADPTGKTNNALAALLKTSFEHYLDAPSLALVMPIIDRGLRQRSSETKRKSVQIVGNMASLTESRDLIPYLNELMPLVHEVLVDPVPEARATAAKSLGTLVERLGETNFPTLVTDLLTSLKSDTASVDREGAAQGLSEVLSGLGMERMEGLLPEIIANTGSPKPYVREGFIALLVYLPTTFGHRFAPHLGRVIPPILKGLADVSDFVRDASMRAGKMIIANYSTKAIDLLLPELEKGMLDASWRIRQSSISLTGDLLYRVTGISGKVELDEEEVPAQSADNARKVLLEALGQERRDRVLATLYIVRQDPMGVVRSASIHIWKALVQNTPRTTREILPVLMQTLMSLLGSDEEEQQETASRTLGELCRKNGERIFGEIVPILQKAITSPDVRTREGACLAFSDVLAASNKEVMREYEDTIISSIRKALVDSDASVRSAAARTFDTMQHYMGAKAVDETIPTLLEAMRDPGETSETALQALQEVMSVRANSVFPVLIPTLTVQPITAFNARALGALVKVAGSALNRRLDTVLTALVKSLESERDEDVLEEINGAVESLLESVVDSDGVHSLMMLLISWSKDNSPTRRATACTIFGTLCRVTSADIDDYRIDWIRILVSLFDDRTEEVVAAAWDALESFVKTIDAGDQPSLTVALRRAVEDCGAPGRHVPGFSRPKGVQSIVPILLAGLLNGTQEQREQGALGIGDLVQRTSEAAIKPYIIQLTGPTIRVVGQNLAPQIKAAIFSTQNVLLQEVPVLLKPFVPQLQRILVKATADPALSVRSRAIAALGELIKQHQPRVEQSVGDLLLALKTADSDVAASLLHALGAITGNTKNMSDASRASIVGVVEEGFGAGKPDVYSVGLGKVVAGFAKTDLETAKPIVETFLAAPTPPTPVVSNVILAILEDAPDAFYELEVVEEIVAKVRAAIASDSAATARPAREARELMRSLPRYEEDGKVQAGFR